MKDIITLYKYIPIGKVISSEIIKRNTSQRELARSIGEHYQTLNAVINGHRKLTVELSYKLDLAFRFPPETLYVLQAYHEMDVYQRQRIIDYPMTPPNVRRAVFWDVDFDKMDWIRYQKFALDRVFGYGTAEDKKEILRYYSLEHIYYVPE